MRAVLYTCLASATPEEVEAERAECERIALAARCQIIAHVNDRSPDRSGLDRLLETAGSEGIEALVVTSIDQLGLDPARLRQITARLEQAGVEVITPHPNLGYAYQRIRDALLSPWEFGGDRENKDVRDCELGED